MLNEELLDSKTKKIAFLSSQIKAFKKYDEERKAYYKDALIRLGESEELINCIESSDPIAELKNLVVEKNNIIKELRRTNDLINICNKYSGEDLKNFKDLTTKHANNVEVEKLKLKLTLLRKKIKQYESE